jgi:hypothetical protein
VCARAAHYGAPICYLLAFIHGKQSLQTSVCWGGLEQHATVPHTSTSTRDGCESEGAIEQAAIALAVLQAAFFDLEEGRERGDHRAIELQAERVQLDVDVAVDYFCCCRPVCTLRQCQVVLEKAGEAATLCAT